MKVNRIIKAGFIIGIIDAWLYIGNIIGWVTVSTEFSPNIIWGLLLAVSLVLVILGFFSYYAKKHNIKVVEIK